MSGTVVSEGNTITAGANVTITTTIVKNECRCPSRSEPFPDRRRSTALLRSVASKSPQNAECVSDLVRLAAEKLQGSAKYLSEQLEKPLAPPAEYVSLVKTLEGICRSTVPAIATTLSGECEADLLLWRKLLDIVSYMQKIAENTALARELSFQGLIGKLNHPRDIWSLFLTMFTLAYWIACERRLLTAVNQDLEGLRLAANSILLELSMSLPKDPPVDLITFQDFFGARWHLSRDFCLDRDIFQNVLHARFRNGPAEYFVVTGQFIVFDQATAKAIGLSSWSGAIASGQELQLSVVVNRPKVTKKECIECPRCSRRVIYLRDASEWVDCHQCGASFSVRAAEQGPDGEYQVTSPASGDDFTSNSANRSSGFKFYSIRATQELSLQGSTLTSGRDMSVSQTTYNITNVAGAASFNAEHLRVEEEWKKLFVHIVEKAKRKNENPDEEESDQASVNPKSTTKRFIIYTAVDIASKKLKSTVTIALTLTPAGPTRSGQPWPAIIWKTLVFQPGARRQDIRWYSQMGFITVQEKAGGVLSPHGLEAVVEPKHIAIFPDSEEPIFSPQEELPIETTSVAILNKSPQCQRFALCVVDRTRVDTDQFLPVVDLGSLSPDGILVCDPPVMLQAYVVSPNAGYEERKPLKVEDMKRPLFPQPINVTQLKPTTPFRLYSNNTGKIILEKE